MSLLNSGSLLALLGAVGIAAGLATMGASLDEETDGSLERACAGLPTNRQLEDTLSVARALTNDGFDPICSSVQAQVADAGARVIVSSRGDGKP